jgi:hypothetical protein
MSKALSLDLRQRVVAAVRDERLSHRAAAARFKVGATPAFAPSTATGKPQLQHKFP